MKLVVCCLVAVAYCVVVCAERDDRDRIEKKRHEVFNRIIKLNKTLKKSNLTLHTPLSSEVENCCSLSALRCFRKELDKLSHELSHKPSHKQNLMVLLRNLGDPDTENGVNFCSTEEIKDTVCTPCHSHPKKDAKEFVTQLKYLFQKANSM